MGHKQLKIRISDEEKDFLEVEAKEHGMSINQYVRYKILDTEKAIQDDFDATDFLNKQLPMLTRVMIDSYFHIRELASKQMSTETLAAVEKRTSQYIGKLNINKK